MSMINNVLWDLIEEESKQLHWFCKLVVFNLYKFAAAELFL